MHLFRREADIWYPLNHPHIVNLFGACDVRPPCFVCDFAENGQLDTYLRKGENLKHLWRMLYQAALGLQYLQAEGVVHGDLKCNNILVTVDGKAKLADFGLSSRGGSQLKTGALRWTAPECLKAGKGSEASFTSDIYSFAMCIIEAVTGDLPWRYVKAAAGSHLPDVKLRRVIMRTTHQKVQELNDVEWELVQQMCCTDAKQRLRIDAVVAVLEVFAAQTAVFDELFTSEIISRVDGEMTQLAELGQLVEDARRAGQQSTQVESEVEKRASMLDIPSSSRDTSGHVTAGGMHSTTLINLHLGKLIPEALADIAELCHKLKENEEMCRLVYGRLKFVSEQLNKISDEEIVHKKRVIFMYGKIVANFLKFLTRQSQKSFIKRLASNRKVVAAIQDFNEDIDELYKLLNLVHVQEVAKWKKQLAQEHQMQEKMLLEVAAIPEIIYAEMNSKDDNLVESLAMLKYEMTHNREQHSPDALAMMKVTFDAIMRTSNAKVPAVPEWFISSDDVEFDTNEAFDMGSYGAVTRGTWGKGAKVVIKSLLMDDDYAKESFFREVEVWNKLSNPHIVQLFGACHVSTPAFFVCEDAIHGNFADHFREVDKSDIWGLFYEAALGLDYLHSEKVVHGDLKCNNIVIGADDKAKICDFGFSYIRSQCAGLSMKAQTNTLRWKALECLLPASEEDPGAVNPRFASDVYSFGMCIIEAFSDEPPYALDDDDTIMEKVFGGEEYPRPEGLKDDEWELVKRLTDPDWQQRINLATAISELQVFAEREKERNSADKTGRVCPCCSATVAAQFRFCGECGTLVSASS
jgi:serine/threonine protein kinase